MNWWSHGRQHAAIFSNLNILVGRPGSMLGSDLRRKSVAVAGIVGPNRHQSKCQDIQADSLVGSRRGSSTWSQGYTGYWEDGCEYRQNSGYGR